MLSGPFLSLAVALALMSTLQSATPAGAQELHPHTPTVSGMPQGVPIFCLNPTTSSKTTGAWSNPTTWSTGKVPGSNDRIAILPGHTVTYDVVADAKIDCIEVRGKLTFKTDGNTHLKVVTVMVFEDGWLEVGSPAKPIDGEATAEIVIADQPFDRNIDPAQIGNGIVAFGKVTIHGAIKTPTFLRVSREPLAGQTTIAMEGPVTGWKPGDRLVLPDTRQLREGQRGKSYQPGDEKTQIAGVSGNEITLTAPLVRDHKGARNGDGVVEFLPHVGNLSRNVIVRSENPAGVRGHTMFLSHADIDIRFAEFRELGRTRMGMLDSADFDSQGRVAKVGINQIGRYAVHFHHNFGPVQTPSNGYQFTLVGNAVDGSTKWGITIHRTHYGLVQDNVVYNTRGAGIVTEDGTESFNVFDHNFSLRTAGSRDAVAGNGYSSTLPNPGGEGAAFWFRGPHNYIRNNVAANAAEYGFGLPVTKLGTVRIPKGKGSDMSQASQVVAFDTTRAPVLEFSNNEAYGAMRSGLNWAWSGSIAKFTVWHAWEHGITATPTETLTIEQLTARGDASALISAEESPAGLWVANYASKKVVVNQVDVQGMRLGVSSPFFYGRQPEASGHGSFTIENSYFRTQIGVNVATGYTTESAGGMPLKQAIVRSLRFDPLVVPGTAAIPSEAISMNYGMRPGDAQPRNPILVYDYDKVSGNNFSIYYSFQAPEAVAPCHETRPGFGGWVCK